MASNPFTRFWRYFKALLNGKLDQYEDPEVILNEAVREMKDNQIKNRELAVQAITEKNNLQNVVDKEERMVAELEKKATIALQGGNRDLARQFLKEKALHEQTLENMRGNLAAAIESSEKVKVAIRQEEDRIRVRTAEALAMKANLKQAQIQIKINKALDQFQFSENEQQWTAASDRIRGLQSEASARAEIASTSIDSRLRDMEYNQMDAAADQELEKLESKLAASPANAYTTATTQQVQMVGAGGAAASSGTAAAPSAAESEVDRQLAELEAKLNQK
jgi:phage shock protein A